MHCTYIPFEFPIHFVSGDIMVYMNIEKLLAKKGKSKYWLVQQLGTNYTVINKMIASDTTAIRFDTMEKLCKLFDCTPNDLFTIE